MRRFGDLLARLGGADLRILKVIPSARGDFQQMALILLSTAGVATLSMFFALTTAVFRGGREAADDGGAGVGGMEAIPGWVAWALALAWGFIILNLDRYLTTSMTSSWRAGKLLAMASVRLALALVIGLVISTPLVLQVFRSDITTRMQETNIQTQERQLAELEGAYEKNRAAANAEVTAAEVALAEAKESGLDVSTDSALKAAEATVVSLQEAYETTMAAAQRAQDVWSCDYYGNPTREQLTELYGDAGGCSGKPGPNYPAPALKDQADAAKAAQGEAKEQLDAAQAELARIRSDLTAGAEGARGDVATAVDDAQAKVVDAREKRTAVEEDYMAKQREVQAVTTANVGLQAQIQALWREGDGGLRIAHLVVAALFVLIELLPVLVKTLRCWGPTTAYDALREGEEARVVRRYPRDADADDQIADDLIATRLEIAQDRHQREKQIGLAANKRYAEVAEDVALREIERVRSATGPRHGRGS
ncbi:MAG: DUF4407 domain-containing protein [Bifidobacteriaceae bacterium]|jgi:hypothetical protein|nr:DUF4407 domain-containing protein [Bifidobacteriaceae bacterium]